MPPLTMPPLEEDHLVSPHRRSSSCSDESDSVPSSNRMKKIKFSRVQVQVIASLDDYTAEEFHSSWYSSREKDVMYDEHAKTVRRMEAGKRPKKSNSYRGLENWCKSNSSTLRKIVLACIDSVLDEQERQWSERPDTVDWERFREVSWKISKESATLAYKMATYDENQAHKAYVSMAKKEFMDNQKQQRRQSLSASVCSETTEMTNSTMVQDIKQKHLKIHAVDPLHHLGRVCSSEAISIPKTKKTKKRSSKTRSAKGIERLGDALASTKKMDVLREREPLAELLFGE